MTRFILLFSFSLFCFPFSTLAQEPNKDSTFTGKTILDIEEKEHSPRKATIMSALVPGLGQIYNKKYWKLPLVYGALGTSIYFIFWNTNNYKDYRCEYLYRLDNPGLSNSGFEQFTDANLLTLIDQYQRWRDLSYVFATASYLINIIDATVDAHLYNFKLKMTDDLTLNIRPHFNIATRPFAGLRLSLKL